MNANELNKIISESMLTIWLDYLDFRANVGANCSSLRLYLIQSEKLGEFSWVLDSIW